MKYLASFTMGILEGIKTVSTPNTNPKTFQIQIWIKKQISAPKTLMKGTYSIYNLMAVTVKNITCLCCKCTSLIRGGGGFYHPTDRKYGASPDGIGQTFLVEVKTSGNRL